MAASLILVVVLLCAIPHVEVHGSFTESDVAELVQLGRAENRHALLDWSPTPAHGSFSDIIRKFKRTVSMDSIRINRESEEQARVAIHTRRLMARNSRTEYLFAKTKDGWKLVPPPSPME